MRAATSGACAASAETRAAECSGFTLRGYAADPTSAACDAPPPRGPSRDGAGCSHASCALAEVTRSPRAVRVISARTHDLDGQNASPPQLGLRLELSTDETTAPAAERGGSDDESWPIIFPFRMPLPRSARAANCGSRG
jgi:hypothetical protein